MSRTTNVPYGATCENQHPMRDGGVAVQRRWGWSEVGDDHGVRAAVVVRGGDGCWVREAAPVCGYEGVFGCGVVFASAAGGGGRKPAGAAPDFERRGEVCVRVRVIMKGNPKC
ncbi:hypothetical protein Tco_0019513 [Tanacetum coccineum]